MTFISSVLSNQGFTPLPTYINPVNVGRCSGRGLSIHQSGKHQRQIPVRQAGQYSGFAHNFGRVGVSAVHAYFFNRKGTVKATQSPSIILKSGA